MKRVLTTAALLSAILPICPAFAQTDTQQPITSAGIQLLPPTPIGSQVLCPAGYQELLAYSGAPQGSGQGGINCVPIVTDAQGDLAAGGYIKPGNSSAACLAANQGAIRYNTTTLAWEGCNGSNWGPLDSGGLTIVEGGCQTYWSGCPTGYTATSYFSPGTYNCCDKCGNPAWRYTVCSQ